MLSCAYGGCSDNGGYRAGSSFDTGIGASGDGFGAGAEVGVAMPVIGGAACRGDRTGSGGRSVVGVGFPDASSAARASDNGRDHGGDPGGGAGNRGRSVVAMAWVVDTCVVLDVATGDPRFGAASARHLKQRLADGLVVCPVTVVELGPAFRGDLGLLRAFLRGAGIAHDENWTSPDTEAAHAGFCRYVAAKRAGSAARRPVADLLIGGFASRFDGLISRDPGHFSPWFPSLTVASPAP